MEIWRVTPARIWGSIVKDRPLGNSHTDCVPTRAHTHGHWWAWALRACFQACLTIEYIPLWDFHQSVLVNMIASMIGYTTSNVTCWFVDHSDHHQAAGCGILHHPLDLGNGCTWEGGLWSALRPLLRMVDCWHVGNGGGIATARCWDSRSGGCAMTVPPWLIVFGSGMKGVCTVSFSHAWSWGWTCWF